MIESERRGEAWVARLTTPQASLTAADVPALKEDLSPLLVDAAPVVLDLGAIEVVDSAGVGALLSIRRTLQELGGRLALAGVRPRVLETLEMLRVHLLVPVFEDVDAALAAGDPP